MAIAYRRWRRPICPAAALSCYWMSYRSIMPSSPLAKLSLNDNSKKTVIQECQDVHETSREASKVLILGGNGFVGTHVCKEALKQDLTVTSLSRSGRPPLHEPWLNDVKWACGSLFEPRTWLEELIGVSAVISCVGGFGSDDTMRKINGEANITAIQTAADAGVKRFVLLSAADFGLPKFFLRGYYEGKKAAEEALQATFPYGGVILRPGVIHGTRIVGGFSIPLSIIGKPLELVLRSTKAATQVPLIGRVLIPPVNVKSVAKTAVRSATDDGIPPGILDIWGIIRLGE